MTTVALDWLSGTSSPGTNNLVITLAGSGYRRTGSRLANVPIAGACSLTAPVPCGGSRPVPSAGPSAPLPWAASPRGRLQPAPPGWPPDAARAGEWTAEQGRTPPPGSYSYPPLQARPG